MVPSPVMDRQEFLTLPIVSSILTGTTKLRTTLDLPSKTWLTLFGLAVGDAFGCPFEFTEGAYDLAVRSAKENRYLQNGVDFFCDPHRVRLAGLYSDDTQQALVLLWIWDMMKAKGLDPKNAASVRELFIKVCQRMSLENVGYHSFGVHRGTGSNFRQAILNGPVDSIGLGAAMRIGPVATLFDTLEELIPWVLEVSSATTTNPIGLAGAAFYAMHVWANVKGLNPDQINMSTILSGLDTEIVDAWKQYEQALDAASVLRHEDLPIASTPEISSGLALPGVAWVIFCAREDAPFEDLLVSSCRFGGDTDTLAAMVGCLATAKHPIPEWMTLNLVGLDDFYGWHPISVEKIHTLREKNLYKKHVAALVQQKKAKVA